MLRPALANFRKSRPQNCPVKGRAPKRYTQSSQFLGTETVLAAAHCPDIIASWATPRLFPRLRFYWRFSWPGGLGAGIAPSSRSLEDNSWAAWERPSRTKPPSASKSPTEATTPHRFSLPSGRSSAETLPFRQSRPLMGEAASSLFSKPPARQRSQRVLSSLTGTNGKPGTFEMSLDGLRDREAITRMRPAVELLSRKDHHVVYGTWQQPKLP